MTTNSTFNPFIDDEDEAPAAASLEAASSYAKAVRKDRAHSPSLAQTRFTKPIERGESKRIRATYEASKAFKKPEGNADDMLSSLLNEDELTSSDSHQEVSAAPKPAPKRDWRREKAPAERREMRRREKEASAAGVLLPGHKKRTKNKVYRRARLTEKDYLVLEFLAKGRYASNAQVAQLLGISNATKRLRGLREWQYLVSSATFFEGSKYLWTVGKNGLKMLHNGGVIDEMEGIAQPTDKISIVNVQHTLAINQVVLMGLAGQLPRVGPLELSEVMSELAIERGFQRTVEGRSAAQVPIARAALREARRGVEQEKYGWSDLATVCPLVWTTIDRRDQGKTHRPDLVINREYMRTSSTPVSIAIEVELTGKHPKELEHIMEAYRQDNQYRYVLYVLQSEALGQKIKKAAKDVGLSGDKLKFVRLAGRDGQPFKGKGWKL